jgi:phosphoglycolate phosphatase
MTLSCLLLDLDGTLVDSAPGIAASAAAALRAVGAAVPGDAVLRGFVGPPMYETFRHVLRLDESTAKHALAVYRRFYAEHGALDSRTYEGVPVLLASLTATGLPMAVATSKVEDQAQRIVRHYGLDSYFETVCGTSDEAGRGTKAEVIRECLARLRARGVDTSHPLMVGDRGYDIESAAGEGIPGIRVLWGYGDEAESAGAVATAGSPEELAKLLLDSTM